MGSRKVIKVPRDVGHTKDRAGKSIRLECRKHVDKKIQKFAQART